MVCVPERSIIPSLKLGDYLSVQAHKPCYISHLNMFGLLHRRTSSRACVCVCVCLCVCGGGGAEQKGDIAGGNY